MNRRIKKVGKSITALLVTGFREIFFLNKLFRERANRIRRLEWSVYHELRKVPNGFITKSCCWLKKSVYRKNSDMEGIARDLLTFILEDDPRKNGPLPDGPSKNGDLSCSVKARSDTTTLDSCGNF